MNTELLSEELQSNINTLADNLNKRLNLLEKILGVHYNSSEIEERGIKSFSLCRLTKKTGSILPVGDIEVIESDGSLYLNGKTYWNYVKGTKEFKSIVHNISHRYLVPTSFNFSQ
jgi:hypothetical protein